MGKRCVYDPDNPPKGAQGADEIEEERDDFLHSTTPVSPLSTKMRSKKWYYRISSKTDIRYHSIEYMIGTFLQQWKVVPECEVEKGCEDCGNWGFNDE